MFEMISNLIRHRKKDEDDALDVSILMSLSDDAKHYEHQYANIVIFNV